MISSEAKASLVGFSSFDQPRSVTKKYILGVRYEYGGVEQPLRTSQRDELEEYLSEPPIDDALLGQLARVSGSAAAFEVLL